LSSVFFFWSLYCLLSFSFVYCIVFCLFLREKDRRQYNDQKKKTEDNTMTKRKRQKTIQSQKEKDRRQYKDQKKKTEDKTKKKKKRQKTKQKKKKKKKKQKKTNKTNKTRCRNSSKVYTNIIKSILTFCQIGVP
jgi:septal ring factor EnvC (AmiA/AmiB activator)